MRWKSGDRAAHLAAECDQKHLQDSFRGEKLLGVWRRTLKSLMSILSGGGNGGEDQGPTQSNRALTAEIKVITALRHLATVNMQQGVLQWRNCTSNFSAFHPAPPYHTAVCSFEKWIYIC